MEMGAGFPESFVSIRRMQNAALSHREKSLEPASVRESLKFTDAAASMRRFFGSCGSAARHDILITEDADGHSGSDKGREARAVKKKRNKWRVRKGGTVCPKRAGVR